MGDDAFLEDSHDHQHDNRVSSVGIDVPGEVVQQKLNQWISWLLKEKGVDLFRSKGVLAVKGMKEKFVFQAIHMLFANSQEGTWEKDEEKRCKILHWQEPGQGGAYEWLHGVHGKVIDGCRGASFQQRKGPPGTL